MSAVAIPARYYARIGEVLASMGIDVADLFASATIDMCVIRETDAYLGMAQVEALFSEVAKRVHIPDLAFAVGRHLKLSSHGILGYGIMTSPTLGYALRLVARYFRMIEPTFSARIQTRDDTLILDITPAVQMTPAFLDFSLEAIAISWYWEMRELMRGEPIGYDTYLSLPEPAYRSRYDQLTGARFHFNPFMDKGLRLIYRAGTLERKLPLADPVALKLSERRCDEMIRYMQRTGSLADWVRQRLWEARDDWPTLTELADRLNMSARTLDRTLAADGLHFREVTKSIRYERACHLLADRNRPILDIALELGYSDSANFTRAFRKWSGVSPSEWRELGSA